MTSRAPLIPLPEEKRPKEHKQKAKNSRSLQPHTTANSEARVLIQTLQEQKEKWQEEMASQVVQTGKSNYSRESLQRKRHMEPATVQTNTELQRNTQPVEARLINYPLISPVQQGVFNRGSSESGQKK